MISNVISIENMLDAYGEEATVELISSFSCARDSIQKNEEAKIAKWSYWKGYLLQTGIENYLKQQLNCMVRTYMRIILIFLLKKP